MSTANRLISSQRNEENPGVNTAKYKETPWALGILPFRSVLLSHSLMKNSFRFSAVDWTKDSLRGLSAYTNTRMPLQTAAVPSWNTLGIVPRPTVGQHTNQ